MRGLLSSLCSLAETRGVSCVWWQRGVNTHLRTHMEVCVWTHMAVCVDAHVSVCGRTCRRVHMSACSHVRCLTVSSFAISTNVFLLWLCGRF